MESDTLAAERAFRRAGLPSFIADYSAGDDVFTKASPWLVTIATAEVVVALNASWPAWANALVGLAGLGVIFGGLLTLSRWRTGHWSLLPRHVGRGELIAFVVVPALLPLAAAGQWGSALATAGTNTLLLALIYLVVSRGVIATTIATLTRAAGELAASLSRLVRVLPLLLIFSVVLFINTEMWQVFAVLPGSLLAVLTAFFALLIVSLVSLRLTSLTSDLEGAIAIGGEGRRPVGGPPLSRRERGNVRVLIAVSQLTHVAGVALGMGLFFSVFGALTIGGSVLRQWSVTTTTWQWDLTLGNTTLLFSNVHLRVALAIACLTGLYYAVTVMSDRDYRREFVTGMADELAPVFARRRDYLAQLATPPDHATTVG